MTPDWDAWSCEPWAQEELRTRPPTSPYADYAGAPPTDAAKELPPPPIAQLSNPKPRPSPPPAAMRLAAPPGLPAPPPQNRHARRAEARAALKRAAQRRAS